MRTIRTAAAGLFIAASTAAAQNSVSVAGIAYDSLHARPLAGAMVGIIGTRLSATTDSAGRFLIENVPPGTYRFAAQHDVIDAIGMSAIGASAKITDGKETVRLYVPSFAQLWKVVCGPTPPATPDTGFIFGSVRPGAGMKSAGGAVVSGSWLDLVAQGVNVQQKLKTLEVNADSTGSYALCGVPTFTGVALRASTDSAESGLFSLDPLDKERVGRRDLKLGTLLANVVAAKRGATLTGKIVADSGIGPVSNAEVSLEEMGIKTTTNEKGEYSLGDILPGTHTVHVKRIGFAEAVARVEVDEADVRQRDFTINKVTLLDSVAVTAKPSAREEQMRTFEEHRKLGNGKFVTRDELKKAGQTPLTTILRTFNGLNVVQLPGGRTALMAKRGLKSGIQGSSSCPVMVYLDGVLQTPQPDMSEFPPEDLEGVEYYAGASRIPIEYNKLGAPCGVLVLHSHWKK